MKTLKAPWVTVNYSVGVHVSFSFFMVENIVESKSDFLATMSERLKNREIQIAQDIVINKQGLPNNTDLLLFIPFTLDNDENVVLKIVQDVCREYYQKLPVIEGYKRSKIKKKFISDLIFSEFVEKQPKDTLFNIILYFGDKFYKVPNKKGGDKRKYKELKSVIVPNYRYLSKNMTSEMFKTLQENLNSRSFDFIKTQIKLPFKRNHENSEIKNNMFLNGELSDKGELVVLTLLKPTSSTKKIKPVIASTIKIDFIKNKDDSNSIVYDIKSPITFDNCTDLFQMLRNTLSNTSDNRYLSNENGGVVSSYLKFIQELFYDKKKIGDKEFVIDYEKEAELNTSYLDVKTKKPNYKE